MKEKKATKAQLIKAWNDAGKESKKIKTVEDFKKAMSSVKPKLDKALEKIDDKDLAAEIKDILS